MKKPPTPFSRTDLGHIFFLVSSLLCVACSLGFSWWFSRKD